MRAALLTSVLLLASSAHATIINDPPTNFPGWITGPCGGSPGPVQGVVANGQLSCGAGQVGTPLNGFGWALPPNTVTWGYVSASNANASGFIGGGPIFPIVALIERDPSVTLAVTPVEITNELGIQVLLQTVIAVVPQHSGVFTADAAAFAAGIATYGFLEAPNPMTALTAATALGIALAAGVDAGMFDPASPPPANGDPPYTFVADLPDGVVLSGSFDGVPSDGSIVDVQNVVFDQAITPVPGPVVGAGVPGLVVVALLVLVWLGFPSRNSSPL